MTLKHLDIDKSWTLFLDRDGVINKKLENDYVRNWIAFEFLHGVFDAMKIVSPLFNKIIVVTNQQGIGKGLYTKEDLEVIHTNMNYEIAYHGGRIDRVYFSPFLDKENHPTRKPNTGMGLIAKQDFPEIDFAKSIMVGDSATDMQFGKSLGMKTVFISETLSKVQEADFCFTSLIEFSLNLNR